MATHFEVSVKPLHVARKIAKIIARENAEAANTYLTKFEIREAIERGARDNVLGIKTP
jgi:hypothetical protein